MGARAPSPNNRQISSSREAESVFDIFMRLWINVWFQPLTCRRNRRAREEFGCRIGSTSLTILEVIWDAQQGEHGREGAHSDSRRNNSRDALVRLGIQSQRLSSCLQER